MYAPYGASYTYIKVVYSNTFTSETQLNGSPLLTFLSRKGDGAKLYMKTKIDSF